MQLLVPPTVALTQFLNLLCNLRNCEPKYPSPVSLLPPGFRSSPDPPTPVGTAVLISSSASESSRRNDPIENGIEDGSSGGSEATPLPPPLVHTSLGSLEGYFMEVVSGRKIYAFEGIRYAVAPTGTLRFQAPLPIPPWKGLQQAQDPGPKCIQLDRGRVKGSEDCLRLSIYSPKIPQDARNPNLPVFIFLHGGSFLFGSGSLYGPAYLLEQDVILVTLNYRLGIMGAFSTGDAVASGNWGLKDQALAISFVYQHVSNFGGDPSRILLIGQSAGGVSTHLHLMSKSSVNDKLWAAISISGTAYNFWGLNTLSQGRRVSRASARLVFCPTAAGSHVLLRCMQRVSPEWLVANQLLSIVSGRSGRVGRVALLLCPELSEKIVSSSQNWGLPVPMIEPDVPGAFLTQSPDDAYRNGNVSRIPWIVTVTSEESNTVIAELAARGGVPVLNQIFDVDGPTLLGLRGKLSSPAKEMEVMQRVREYYGVQKTQLFLPRRFFTEVANARYFTVPFHKGIQMHSQIAPTFPAIFNYTNYVGTPGRLGLDPKEYGVAHTDDLVFLFNSSGHPPIGRRDNGFAITKLCVNAYVNYAKGRVPLFTERGVDYGFWDSVKDPEAVNVLQIDEEVKMIRSPYGNVTRFWESLKIPDMTPYVRLRS